MCIGCPFIVFTLNAHSTNVDPNAGISRNPNRTDKDIAFDQFVSSVKMNGTSYEVSLPLYEGIGPSDSQLTTNLVKVGLWGLLRWLQQTPEILKEYNLISRTQRKDGAVEVVKEDGMSPGAEPYLPHHTVIRQDKDATKARVVHNSPAKSSGSFLNECLHVDPKFLQRSMSYYSDFDLILWPC